MICPSFLQPIYTEHRAVQFVISVISKFMYFTKVFFNQKYVSLFYSLIVINFFVLNFVICFIINNLHFLKEREWKKWLPETELCTHFFCQIYHHSASDLLKKMFVSSNIYIFFQIYFHAFFSFLFFII